MTPSKDKRRLRDTKVGAWLTTKAPAILDAVGDALPDSGMLGVVKNLVDVDPDVNSWSLWLGLAMYVGSIVALATFAIVLTAGQSSNWT